MYFKYREQNLIGFALLLTKMPICRKIRLEERLKKMYEEKKFLTAREILEKDFKIDARGYRPQEVDQFLDMIIKDYVEFETTTKKMISEIKRLEDENSKLKSENRNLKASLDIAGSNKGVTNVDLLKRISDLEKVVYGE
jgi:DivIVA domain-containing protein